MSTAFRVFKVRHTMLRGGKNAGHFNSDLIFVDGVPTVVIEWLVTPSGNVPSTTVQLAPTFLHLLPGWEPAPFYLYEHPIDFPGRPDLFK